MNQTLENSKEPNLRLNFGSFGPTLGPQIYFHEFYLY